MGEVGSQVFERNGKVVLVMRGQHTLEDAQACMKATTLLFRQLGKCEFVADLRELLGYEPAARSAWQEHLSQIRSSIHTLTMVGGTPLMRMSGAAVCLYAGIKMRLVKDLEEAFPPPRGSHAS
jgi:hypothetical protein